MRNDVFDAMARRQVDVMTLVKDIPFRTIGRRLTDELGRGSIRVKDLARHAPRSRLVT